MDVNLPQDLLERPTLALEVEKYRAVLEREAGAREAFRDAIQPHEKGEFINGKAIMHSPARHVHNITRALIERLISTLIDSGRIDGVVVSEKACCGSTRNDYEPDVAWFGPAKAAKLDADTTIYPVPDFVVEVLSPETRKNDRGVKFTDYAAHGVGEYWIVDADAGTVDQFELDASGEYRSRKPQGDGGIASLSFPGLIIPLAAIFDGRSNLSFLAGFAPVQGAEALARR